MPKTWNSQLEAGLVFVGVDPCSNRPSSKHRPALKKLRGLADAGERKPQAAAEAE
jgi:hypothetical protein